MIQTFTAATIDSMTARMGARRLMRPHFMVATHLSHGSCAGINEQDRRADSISAAMCQIADPTRYGKYAVTVQAVRQAYARRHRGTVGPNNYKREGVRCTP